MKTPEDCLTKKDIRDEIDRLDEELVRLFAVRQGFVRRMSELKRHPDEAFDAERIESMIEIIRKRAEELGLEADQADMVWRTLIDWNIAFERRVIAARLERNSQVASITPD